MAEEAKEIKPGMSYDDIKTLIINSFKSSFLTKEKKMEWISKI